MSSSKLVRNSFFLGLGSAIRSLLGLAFLLILSRLYAAEQIGIASNLLNSLGIIMTIAIFGFDDVIVRYYSKASHKPELIGTSFVTTALLSLIGGIVFAVFLGLTLPATDLLNPWILLTYLFSVVAWVLFAMLEPVYIAMRESQFILIKHFTFSVLKIVGSFLFLFLGYYGIFLSWTIPALLVLLLLLSIKKIPFNFRFNTQIFKKYLRFSLVNYVSNFLFWFKLFIIPFAVTKLLGPAEAGIFYIVFSVLNFAYVIPASLSKSLLAEVSHDEKEFGTNLRKSLYLALIFSLMFILSVFLFGRFLLLFFGEEFTISLSLLKLLSVAVFFISLNEIFLAVAKHHAEGFYIFMAKGLSSLCVVILAALLLLELGLIGIGYAYIMGQGIIAIILFFKYKNEITADK